MKILFTKSEKSLSKWIRATTEEPVSHCAIECGWIVVHANLLGVHLEWAKNFRKHSEVVFQLERKMTDELEHAQLSRLLEKYEFSMYDFGALFFIGFAFLLRSKLKIPLPKSNLWQQSGMFLCTELVSDFAAAFKEDNSMITPYKLYLKLKEREWEDGTQTQSRVSDR